MPRPPIGPVSMEKTVKFRLSDAELGMLGKIADTRPLSAALRSMIHDEYHRKFGTTD